MLRPLARQVAQEIRRHEIILGLPPVQKRLG
jgi:hypothetical protein